MKRLKTYKQLFESEHFDSFDLIKDYINEFCDTFDFDLYPNDTEDKIYLKTNSNGIFVWRLLDNKWEKEIKYHSIDSLSERINQFINYDNYIFSDKECGDYDDRFIVL